MELRMNARGVKRSETEEEEEKGNNLKKGNTYEEEMEEVWKYIWAKRKIKVKGKNNIIKSRYTPVPTRTNRKCLKGKCTKKYYNLIELENKSNAIHKG